MESAELMINVEERESAQVMVNVLDVKRNLIAEVAYHV